MVLMSNLNKALRKFGDDLKVIRKAGNIDIKGKTGRIRRVTNPWAMQYLRQAVFSPDVEIDPGEIIRDKTQDIYFFIYIMQKNYKAATLVAQSIRLLLADSLCEIQRLQGTAGPIGGTTQSFVSQKTNIKCHLREISADLRTERPALLERAGFLLYTQSTENLVILDRIVIDSINYQVEHINKTSLEGLSETQMSLDKR